MIRRTESISRRNIIRTTSVAAVAGLAGCGGGGGGSTTSDSFKLLHAWSSGDGNEAITAFIDGFREANPDVEVDAEAISGAARGNLDQVVLNKLQSNIPPSTFQTWPGKTLRKFGDAYTDIEDTVWDREMKNNYLPGPKAQARLDGTYVTVPLNIHRLNNLFYNVGVVKEAGVDPASLSTPGDVVDACEQVASNTDAVPFAHQTSSAWSTVQLWETVLLAQAGIDGYEAFYEGNGDEDQVRSALETVTEYSDYYPSDASSIDFTEANTMVMEDEAAFIQQGDWAAGAYGGRDEFDYGEHWDQVTYPGTSGSYVLVMDSFPYLDDNPTPEVTRKFLRYCGSPDGQVLFNREKGSIPPRSDADVSSLNAFQQDQFEEFTDADDQPPSIQHGLAVSPSVATNIESAFSGFLETYDAAATADALIDAFN